MSDPDEDLTGRVLLGKLRVLRRLGAGGMGSVYEVQHTITHNRHALKVLHSRLAMNANAAQRLVREAGVAGQVRSARIVQTIDVGQLEDGRPFILMELLEGRSWRDLLVARGALSPSEAIRLALQVCEGLGAAHAAGIIHRDLKPDNVFLTGPEGAEQVTLVDFGLGKDITGSRDGPLTEAGALMGTAEYLSPEQAAGRLDLDGRTDQFALGVMLYESLSGRRPFAGDSFGEVLASIAEGRYVPLSRAAPHLPPALAQVVERAMSPSREGRFDRIVDLAAALRAFADVDGVAPSPRGGAIATAPTVLQAGVAPTVALPSTRRPPSLALFVVLAVGAIAGAAAGAFAWWTARSTEAPSPSEALEIAAPEAFDGGAVLAPSDASVEAADAGVQPTSEHIYSEPEDLAEAALVVRLDEHFERREYQRCLERSEQERPTPATLERRATCAMVSGCLRTFIETCEQLEAVAPDHWFTVHQCHLIVPTLPDIDHGPYCTYRGP